MKNIESEKTKFKHAPRENFCQHVSYQQLKIQQHYIY